MYVDLCITGIGKVSQRTRESDVTDLETVDRNCEVLWVQAPV